MIHLIKVAVGVRNITHLAEIQAGRAAQNPPLRHQTRNTPKRAAELCAGGSIFWVINRIIQVRQRVTAIIEDVWDDGSACAGLILHPVLVPVVGRAQKPFQGWRYLVAAEAPPDLAGAGAVTGPVDLPESLRLALTQLALL